MSTVTARRIARDARALRFEGRQRDHFQWAGVSRGLCLGNPGATAKRVIDGMITKAGALHSIILFRHPTKKRTKGRMCWRIVGVKA